MRGRCLNPKDPSFSRYGGRGITICSRWGDYAAFVADMGLRPLGTTLDRYPNNDGNYEPCNCRWATPREQAQNRRSTRTILHGNQTRCKAEAARLVGISKELLNYRLNRGLPAAQALAPITYVHPTYQGRTQSVAAWAREVGIKRTTLLARLQHGWSIERALTASLQPQGGNTQ